MSAIRVATPEFAAPEEMRGQVVRSADESYR